MTIFIIIPKSLFLTRSVMIYCQFSRDSTTFARNVSASITVVTCGAVRLLSCMCSAIRFRIGDKGIVLPGTAMGSLGFWDGVSSSLFEKTISVGRKRSPSAGLGTSVVTLSVSTSRSPSYSSIPSPSCFNQAFTVPSTIDSPSLGVITLSSQKKMLPHKALLTRNESMRYNKLVIFGK